MLSPRIMSSSLLAVHRIIHMTLSRLEPLLYLMHLLALRKTRKKEGKKDVIILK